ncbi:MAG TPA: class I adenylate-forming enzyme family protein [Acidimicrobiales bacterium]|nr:class I adenylate-forming enzyme family protein [Acidimicrobiales bacterium]
MAIPTVSDDERRRYREAGWWGDRTLAQVIGQHARRHPEGPAYIVVGAGPGGTDRTLTWADYDRQSSQLAAVLVAAGLEPGDRLGVVLPDGAAVHVAFVAAEKAGLVVAGIGARAGDAEVRHLLAHTGARAVVTHDTLRDRPAAAVVAALRGSTAGNGETVAPDLLHVEIPPWPDDPASPVGGASPAGGTSPVSGTSPARGTSGARIDGRPVADPPVAETERLLAGRAVGPDDLFMLNSTSGTTGLPKCVMHAQNRWFYFHQLVVDAAEMVPGDVFFGAVPAPFGFGLWTAHFTPALLGSPTVVMERFEVGRALRAMARHEVTVLACVSTQFIMMLNAPELETVDLTALRAMFTGGEAVPYDRAAAFEERTGAAVLQVYGSNESGAFSRSTLRDSRERRLTTTGRVIEEMAVRVFDDDGRDVTGPVRVGVPGGRGPATCLGYYADDAANAQLFTDDGWLLMGDIVEIDEDGYLKVVGRTSDIIIRGGKNISAPAVEAELAEHPAVAHVAVVAMPDDVFGERVCAYVVPRPGTTVTLGALVGFLADRGITREWFPEGLVVVDDLPTSSGAKVAKGDLRQDVRARLAAGTVLRA